MPKNVRKLEDVIDAILTCLPDGLLYDSMRKDLENLRDNGMHPFRPLEDTRVTESKWKLLADLLETRFGQRANNAWQQEISDIVKGRSNRGNP